MARSSRTSSRKKKATATIDFTGVESGGRSCPDGTYRFKVTEAELTESSEGNPMHKIKLKGLNGKAKGVTIFDNLSHVPQALWKLKTFLQSITGEEPDGEVEIDCSDWIDEEVKAVIFNEKYEGKDRPKVGEYLLDGKDDDEEEEEDEESEEEEESEDEDEEEESEDEEEEEEEEESEDEDEEESEEEEDEESEDEDEEEEEEDEKPAKKPRGKKPSGKTSKFRVGQKVKFKDDKGKTVTGVVMTVDGDTVTIEDKKGQEWEVESSELTAA